ncbi:MAG: class I SAM-dependent methyltransferase [Thermoanaerobaculia bacterium]
MPLLGRLRLWVASKAVRHGGHPKVLEIPDDYLSPADLMKEHSVDALRQTAEEYFSRLTEWKDHLTKPFSRIEDVPQLLINFAVMIQGMELVPGMTVLDFAAGSCWASHIFSQLGCRAIALDVSPTALAIGKELYAKRPVIGDSIPPEFVVFDGRHIPLPDSSVDRILSFDAFHHVPNPQEVLWEMSRVLVDGGIAAFAEPGPRHSRAPQSQFEMKTFKVLENDVVVEDIWRMAQAAGFSDLRLAGFNAAPFHVPLDGYRDLVDGGETSIHYIDLTRQFLSNVRDFFLRKGERGPGDSRRPEGLRATIEISVDSTTVRVGETIRGRATVTNAGAPAWLPSEVPRGGVSLAAHLFRGNGELVNFDYAWMKLRAGVEGAPIREGESVSVDLAIPAPAEPGIYTLEFDAVSNQVCWFGQMGSKTVRVEITVGH